MKKRVLTSLLTLLLLPVWAAAAEPLPDAGPGASFVDGECSG